MVFSLLATAPLPPSWPRSVRWLSKEPDGWKITLPNKSATMIWPLPVKSSRTSFRKRCPKSRATTLPLGIDRQMKPAATFTTLSHSTNPLPTLTGGRDRSWHWTRTLCHANALHDPDGSSIRCFFGRYRHPPQQSARRRPKHQPIYHRHRGYTRWSKPPVRLPRTGQGPLLFFRHQTQTHETLSTSTVPLGIVANAPLVLPSRFNLNPVIF